MQNPGKKNAVLVLGMHRSGTSAISRTMNILGCDLPRTLMPQGPGNDLGHWESQAIADYNDTILTRLGSGWVDWQAFDPNWHEAPAFRGEIEAAAELLSAEFPASNFFVLKDPRMARLATFWLAVLDHLEIATSIIIPVRNPIDVARSLESRDGIRMDYAKLLWMRYTLDAELATRDRARIFVSYDRLLASPEVTVGKISTHFGFEWPRRSTLAADEIRAFLSSSHRHHVSDLQDVVANPWEASWTKVVFPVLDRWSVEGENEGERADLDKVRASLNAASQALGSLVFAARAHAGQGANATAGQVAVNTGENERLAAEVEALRERAAAAQYFADKVDRLQNALLTVDPSLPEWFEGWEIVEHTKGAVDLLREQLTARDAVISELAAQTATLQQVQAERDEVRSQLASEAIRTADFERVAIDANARLAELEGEIADVRGQLHESMALAGHREAEVARAAEELEALRAALSGRDGELVEARGRLSLSESELRQRQEEIAQTLAASDALRVAVSEQAGALADANVMVESLKQQLAASEGWVFDLARLRHSNEMRLATLESLLEKEKRQHAITARKLANLEEERVAPAEAAAEEVASGASITEDMLAVLHSALKWDVSVGTADQALSLVEEEVQSLRAENARLADELERARQAPPPVAVLAVSSPAGAGGHSDRAPDLSALRSALKWDVLVGGTDQSGAEEREIERLRAENMHLARELEAMRLHPSRPVESVMVTSRDDVAVLERELEVARLRISESDRMRRIVEVQLEQTESRHDVEADRANWLQEVGKVLAQPLPWWAHLLPASYRKKKMFKRLVSRGLFDADAYLNANPDVLAEGHDPLRHYIHHGLDEGRPLR